MKPFKRLISILLCCAMLLTVLPTAALAEAADEYVGRSSDFLLSL